jgi:hypothetical protein
MRFAQLNVGQQFSFEDKRYTKTGPLTASQDGTGNSRMIRRSAEVMIINDVPTTETIEQTKQSYSRQEVLECCGAYQSTLIQELQKLTDDKGSVQVENVISIMSELDASEFI